jgi:FKBP-type peptidyl-prolyl cis-trans isomerase|tara:strand:- start:341 stop:814 length:474 start_codon:yes stop_codon:yes gene_type:complete
LNLRNTFFGIILLSFITSCGGDDPFLFQDDFSTVPEQFSTSGVTPDTTETGLIFYELELGTGLDSVTIRDVVAVYYTGRTTDNEVFDSSYKNGRTDPTNFEVANPSLVDGFSEGLLGMKEGGRRVLVIPPELGYAGTSNSLREDTLVFDVELGTIFF